MMEVYRMEDSKGLGPFIQMDAAGFAQHVDWARHNATMGIFGPSIKPDKTHPHHMHDIPDADIGSDIEGAVKTALGSPWRVGVKDMRQFYHWFPVSSLPWFASRGFHLSDYSVPNTAVKMGTWQLMFDSSKAHLLRTEPLNELAKEAA